MTKLHVLLCCCVFQCLLAHGQVMTGREIVDEQNSRHGSDTEYTKEKMTLIDSSGKQEVRVIRRFSKDMGNDEVRFLFVFDSPKSIRGTALLTWAYDEGESDQWMFLPAQNRLQRIAKGNKKAYFMGTDFTFEDMEPEDLDDFDYEIIDEVQISGLDCWMIKASPNNPQTMQTSSYGHRVLYVLRKYYFTVKIEFYDKRGVKMKTQQNGLLAKIDNQRFRANKIIMTNHESNHRTAVEFISREIDLALENSIFTERYVTSGRHLQ
jgi:hypothetical protein